MTVYGRSPGSAYVTATADYGGYTYDARMEVAVVNRTPDPVYTKEYEHELTVSPDAVTLAEGETASFTATYITREYTLADGVRISDTPDSVTEDDVTGLADWTVADGSRFVGNKGSGVFGWSGGPGEATVSAAFDGCADTAEITTLAHEVVYSKEYEHELALDPDTATLAEGETLAFTAAFITREYTLADGVRVSEVPDATTSADVTSNASWSVRNGSQYVRMTGRGRFGWVSGPGTAVIAATYEGLSDTAGITTLAHQPVYTTEYEYELVISPDSATLAEGESASLTATYITREYTLADGVRTGDVPASTTEVDVTRDANWSVKNGSQYVRSKGKGVFEWVAGPGKAVVSATMDGCSGTAEITTLAHQPVYTTEYEYELVVSPDSATLSEGETTSFTATYITREYTLADGVRISDVPASKTEEDVTRRAAWTVGSGAQLVTNKGNGSFGWASGPGTAVIAATYQGCSDNAVISVSEPDPVPTLTASVSVLDTWGGNDYPVTVTYDDGRGHLTDVTSRAVCSRLDFTGGIPSRFLRWDGSHMVAEDWWGMSGAWVTSSPTYSMTLSYGGLSVEISGTMHGFTGAEVSPAGKVWHYREVEDNGWNAPPVKILLVGSERLEVDDDVRYVDGDHILDNGMIGP